MYTKITYHSYAISYVEADGILDIYRAPDYLDEIKEHLRKKYTEELILDFSKITYVASIGLRAILELHKLMQEQNGILKLKNVNDDILHAFKMTGFDQFLTIENDYDIDEDKNAAEQSD